MLQIGRFEGEIREFRIWDPERTNRLVGSYFVAVCEWLPEKGGWISICEKCHNFRCLKLDMEKQTWGCRCGRVGTFRKPEEKLEKKTDSRPGEGRENE